MTVEIMFKSGRFVTFKKVEEDSLRQDGERLMFIHGDERDRIVVNMRSLEYFKIKD